MKMNKIKVIIFLILITFQMNAQTINVRGVVLDKQSLEPLMGVQVSSGVNKATTGLDGSFIIKNIQKNDTLSFFYTGYDKFILPISNNVDIGNIYLNSNVVMLSDVIVSAQRGVARKTPVAMSNVSAFQIEEKLGNDEFVEALKYTPGVHANRQGGGWADSEIFMRGFDNTNIAVMINGIPVNDIENGTVYWSNWAGLSEVTAYMQVQRGIGVSKLSAPSIGGTINIVTKGLEAEKNLRVFYETGNNAFHHEGFSLSTGLMENGWAITLLGSHSKGDGNAQGTNFETYNYFANISKKLRNNHQIGFTIFGAPQKHYCRSNALTASEWEKVKTQYNLDKDWRDYNPDYGFDSNGQRRTADYNKYHMPFMNLKHIWQINEKSNLTTSIYTAFGRGGGYAGKANSETYSEYDWYGSDYGILNTKFRCNDGTFNYAKIEEINSSSNNGSELIMSRVDGRQDWYGLISTYSNQAFNVLDFFVGIDSRYYKIGHTNRIADLFGGDYYIDPARADVSVNNNPYATDEWKNQHLKVGDVVYRDYDSHVLQNGLFAQAEYNKGIVNVFLSSSLNRTIYWRYDRLYNAGDNARSNTIGFWCGNVKSGINLNLNNRNNIFFNLGFNSKAPQFKSGAFMSANTSNVINTKACNEKSLSAELGYMFITTYLSLKANAYYTQWIDKSMTKKGKITEQYYINMTGVDSRHMGLELELALMPFDCLEANAMLSLGDWKWISDDVKGYAYNLNGQAITPDGEITMPGANNHAFATINMKDIKVGGSAQTTASIDITFKPLDGFRIGGGYLYHGNNYAYYSLAGSSLSLGEEMFVLQPWKMPSYGTFDLWSSYAFKIGNYTATLSGHINNLLNNRYIEKAWNPSNVSKTETTINTEDVYYFYSIGRTWSIKLKFEF